MKTTEAKKHIDLLGFRAEDKVTGFKGVVSSESFDLYGCVQAAVAPGLDKEGKIADSHWFDVVRLKLQSKKPVMVVPNFDFGPQAEGQQGAAEKPAFDKV